MKNVFKKKLIYYTYGQNLKIEKISVYLDLLEMHLKEHLDFENSGMQSLKACYKMIREEIKHLNTISIDLISIAEHIKDQR